MKKSLLLCGLLTALVATMASPKMASAAVGATVWAPVELIAAGSQANTYAWVSLVGVNTAGTCATTTPPGLSNKVIFTVNIDDRGKQLMSMLESAFLSGKSVLVGWDTSVTLSGYCQIISLYVK